MNNSFCVLPWLSITVDPDGSVKPCCVYDGHIQKKDGTKYNLGYDKIEDFFNSSDYLLIREKMLNGEEVSGCKQCTQIESYGKESKRVLMNRRFKESLHQTENFIKPEIQFFDLRFGNLCNLKCRSCMPGNSTQLDKQVQDNPELTKFYPYFGFNITDWYETDIFDHNLNSNVEYLKLVYVAGGEPSLIEKNYKLLQYWIDKGYNKDISLIIVSNATHDNDLFFDLISQFKNVIYYASIDGFKEVQEYLRYPSQWDRIDKNLKKLVAKNAENISIRITPTIQITNLYSITDLFEYCEQINRENDRCAIQIFVNQLENPSFLNLVYLPIEYKKQCWNKIQQWVESKCKYQPQQFHDMLKAVEGKCSKDIDYKEKLKEFFEFNTLLDNCQKYKLFDVNPSLYKLEV